MDQKAGLSVCYEKALYTLFLLLEDVWHHRHPLLQRGVGEIKEESNEKVEKGNRKEA